MLTTVPKSELENAVGFVESPTVMIHIMSLQQSSLCNAFGSCLELAALGQTPTMPKDRHKPQPCHASQAYGTKSSCKQQ